jgi:tripartite-type tricarboxylate transporter receptor subunit TctC
MIAANHVYAVAKPDGLTLGAIGRGLYFDQFVGRKEVRFDWAKFIWIGSPEQSNSLLYMRADTPYRTMEEIRKAEEPPKCGATGTFSTGYFLPKLLEETVGTKFNVVTGYQGGGEIDLAVERGEIQCRAMSIDAFMAREPFHTWRKKGFVRVLIQTGRKGDTRLADIPTIYDLMDRYRTAEAGRRLATIIMASGDFGRPLVAPPGVPSANVKTLREAFRNAMSDPELLAEAKKKKLEADFSAGEELEALAKEVIAQPAEVIERMKKLLGQ